MREEQNELEEWLKQYLFGLALYLLIGSLSFCFAFVIVSVLAPSRSLVLLQQTPAGLLVGLLFIALISLTSWGVKKRHRYY